MTAHTSRHASLELNWLARHEKQLPLPRVLFAPLPLCSGIYFWPWPRAQFEFGLEIPPSNGTIVVSTLYPEMPVPSTLAHEFRHHWQCWNGMLPKKNKGWKEPTDYAEAIALYFTTQLHEWDALRFEIKHAACDVTDEWLDMIHNHRRTRVV